MLALVGVLVHAGIFTLHASSHALSRLAPQHVSHVAGNAAGPAARSSSSEKAPPGHHKAPGSHCPICTGAASLHLALPLDQIALALLVPTTIVLAAADEPLIAGWVFIKVQIRGPPSLQI